MFVLRRLVLAALVSLCSLLPAWANPMLVVDRATLEVLFAEDAGQPWHPASLTKLMTAYVAFEQIQLGVVTLDTPVTISRNAINQAPSKSGLPVDSALSLQDALYILIVKSANDVAVAIAETIGGSEAGFVAMMNDAARRMGLTATHFDNPNGLHSPTQVTTARDLAILSLYIEQNFPQYMPMFATGVVQLGQAKFESQNALLTEFSGTTGMKTGYVCASGLNIVATVDRNGRRLLAVVLGGSSGRERNERAADLFLRALGGQLQPTGQSVLSLGNSVGAPPINMQPMICGKQAADYVKAQEAAYPLGLEGQPSYLTDEIAPRQYVAVDLGRIRPNIALPRPRPPHVSVAPVASAATPMTSVDVVAAAGATNVPFPQPRPASRP